jgi:hypothetical protein
LAHSGRVSCQNVTDKMSAKLTNTIIEAAIDGFQAQKRQIDIQIAELRAMLSGPATEPDTATDEPAKPAKPKRSAAVRKRMAAAQKKRWAVVKGDAAAPAKKASKTGHSLSEEGRAAIVAAMKKRWAAKKAAAKK